MNSVQTTELVEAPAPTTTPDESVPGPLVRPTWRRRAVVPGIAAASCALAVTLFGIGARDDDYITYWAAEQLAKTGRIVNLNGSHLEQSTSLAHVVVLALLYVVTRAPLPLLAYGVGLASLFATVWLAAHAARRVLPRAEIPTAVVVGAAYPIVYWATGGLETDLAALAVLWLVVSLHDVASTATPRRAAMASLVGAAALAITVRPDTQVVAVALALGALLAAVFASSTWGGWLPRLERRGTTIAVACVLGEVAVLAVFRLLVFGSLLPQPDVAKVGGPAWVGAGFSYLFGSFPWWWWVGLLVLLGLGVAWCLRQRSTLGSLLAAAFLLGLGVILFTRGDWMGGARLLVPYLACGLVVAVVGACSLARTWRVVALTAVVAVECLTLVLFADGTTWLSSAYGGAQPSAATAYAANAGSPFGATITSSVGRVPPMPWFTGWDFYHARDAIFLSVATPKLRQVLAAHPGRVTIASYQAGMVAYTWENEFPGRLWFIDTANVATTAFSRCTGIRQTYEGQVITLTQWVHDAGRCAPALPDLIYSLFSPSQTPQLLRYYRPLATVTVRFEHHGPFDSTWLSATEFLAIRRGWHP